MKKTLVVLLCGVFIIGLAALASASNWPPDVMAKVKEFKELADQRKEMPKTIEGVQLITGKEIKKWMDQKKPFILTDNRVKDQYNAEKIKGAKWFLTDHLLADPKMADQFNKNDVIVFYCNGITCWRSPAAALMMKSLGYNNLYWYREGLPDWKKEKFPTE